MYYYSFYYIKHFGYKKRFFRSLLSASLITLSTARNKLITVFFNKAPKSRGLSQLGGPPGWLEESDPEIEFLDINLTKKTFLLNAIHSSSFWQILQKTILYSGF
jgi:hypothetical protein